MGIGTATEETSTKDRPMMVNKWCLDEFSYMHSVGYDTRWCGAWTSVIACMEHWVGEVVPLA